ncbi:MAG TPA: alkene reductase [Methylosinus sp.]|jgi:N-ethylmaleimide reductase|uniref:alkene reductase n=1 Tax=Methylosinus sp. TaxID=427 RepID=UPI002F95BD77
MTDLLFEPFRLGDLALPNRIVMAPLTRRRATHGTNAANALMAEHYRQRAAAGLIIAEASQISQQGQGYSFTPGIYSPEQVAGWRQVTDAVHSAGGRIVLQLWHVGRVSHVSLQPGGGAPVAPSAIATTKQVAIETGFVDCSTPRALALDEIPGIVAEYREAARNAKEAGFDGVEIHCANGYLIDEFLRDGSNKRADAYGGSPQNRARFGLEVADAVLEEWEASRVGVRISPVSPVHDMSDSDPQAVFGYFVERLAEKKLGFIHVIEGATQGPRDVAPFDYRALRESFPGAYIANNAYTLELAEETLASGRADLIAFGRPFIANPDLVERLRRRAPLAPVDYQTVYAAGAEGYTDYPTLTA